jgi:hypothetical protein
MILDRLIYRHLDQFCGKLKTRLEPGSSHTRVRQARAIMIDRWREASTPGFLWLQALHSPEANNNKKDPTSLSLGPLGGLIFQPRR